jgi:hypothetical protein
MCALVRFSDEPTCRPSSPISLTNSSAPSTAPGSCWKRSALPRSGAVDLRSTRNEGAAGLAFSLRRRRRLLRRYRGDDRGGLRAIAVSKKLGLLHRIIVVHENERLVTKRFRLGIGCIRRALKNGFSGDGRDRHGFFSRCRARHDGDRDCRQPEDKRNGRDFEKMDMDVWEF